MQTKQAKDLQAGDKIALSENSPGRITKCGCVRWIEVVGDRAYEIEWRDAAGNFGRAIQAGRDEVETVN